ncbi:MAG: SUMF1/EgtB/PvdO family nonheme iron enzyme [Caldilineaceae bacterium]|nr:SUMF1/EgtB/PvdO family nonheme iron enzyme [Caldilineaceae bacterium]
MNVSRTGLSETGRTLVGGSLLYLLVLASACDANPPAVSTGGGAPYSPTPDRTATAAAILIDQALAATASIPVIEPEQASNEVAAPPAAATFIHSATVDSGATRTAIAFELGTAVAATLTAQPTSTPTPTATIPPSPTDDGMATARAQATQIMVQVQATLAARPSSTPAPASATPRLAIAVTEPVLSAAAPVSVPAIQWIEVPAGDFIMGSTPSDLDAAVAECNRWEGNCEWNWFDNELPQRTVWLPTYRIMAYEVTNADYVACVDADVCAVAGRAISSSNIPYDPLFFAGDRPVVGVSFYDAGAFCAWIGAHLPTEEEWEKAARGVDGRVYPWGNMLDVTRANIGATGPAAVGSFAGGASPWDVQDMAGNAFEWTATRQGDRYILRGGSWFVYPFRGRTADRGTKLEATFANYDVGFRCVQ